MLPFASLILIDPTLLMKKHHDHRLLTRMQEQVLRMAYERRDCWYTIKAASEYLAERAQRWHPDVLQLYTVSRS